VQDLFGVTQGAFNFDGTYTGNDFADFLLGDAKAYTELGVQERAFGITCPGPPTFRTTGASIAS